MCSRWTQVFPSSYTPYRLVSMVTLGYTTHNSTIIYKVTINRTNTVTSSSSASPALHRLTSWSKPSPQQVSSKGLESCVPTHICSHCNVLWYCSWQGSKICSLFHCWSIKPIFNRILNTMLCEMFLLCNVILSSTFVGTLYRLAISIYTSYHSYRLDCNTDWIPAPQYIIWNSDLRLLYELCVPFLTNGVQITIE